MHRVEVESVEDSRNHGAYYECSELGEAVFEALRRAHIQTPKAFCLSLIAHMILNEVFEGDEEDALASILAPGS